jgi:streptogramin lyase
VNLPAFPARTRARTTSWVLPLLVAGCASGAPALTASPATTPSPVASSIVPPSTSQRPPTPAASPTPLPQPVDSTVDGVAVRTLQRGPLSAPIDVVVAFGSVWVANHHGDSVTRVDPTTMTIQATIKTGTGPGWFAVADDAVWVSNQNSVGMTRVDPTTGDTIKTGRWPTCGRSIVAFKAIWQPACDAHRVMRIDQTSFVSTDVPSPGQTSLVRVGSTLVSSGPGGLARLDPKTNSFAPIGGADPGWMMAFDGKTIWSSDERQVFRISPKDGTVVAALAISEAGAVAFHSGRAWVTSASGLVEVDPATNAIVRTLPIGRSVAVVVSGDALWVTSYDANTLTRLMP